MQAYAKGGSEAVARGYSEMKLVLPSERRLG